MVEVLRKCIDCGRTFITVFDKRCDSCQRKKPKTWSHKKKQ